jgi:hypothetical protein
VNPRDILGVPEGAGDAEIHAAYLRKVKEHPPDRSPEEFEKIRDAYQALRDPRRRTREMLLTPDAEVPLATLFASSAPQRKFVGPQAWKDVLKG